MSNRDCQENIKEPMEYGPAMAFTAAGKPIGDVLLSITTIATANAGIFFSLRAMGVGQYDALLTSTSLVWLLTRPVWKR